MVEGFEIS